MGDGEVIKDDKDQKDQCYEQEHGHLEDLWDQEKLDQDEDQWDPCQEDHCQKDQENGTRKWKTKSARWMDGGLKLRATGQGRHDNVKQHQE
ncbi:hypothetical protein NDU88_000981 [Pleurodeles waltl]|uniref:Uncharacterized protein n=1 Tax=Pleurodeles waltl TaxID=8319 RepID=A0AAV7L9Q6_PLEWA|nr:hypothetical protein NDU88_000981 [Pleurodeles waltl]